MVITALKMVVVVTVREVVAIVVMLMELVRKEVVAPLVVAL